MNTAMPWSLESVWMLVAAVVIALAPASGQTREEVLALVDDPFAPESVARLKELGNAALPHLAALANDATLSFNTWNLTTAINAIDTPEASELLIDILAGSTHVRPDSALSNLWLRARWPGRSGSLAGNERFKQVLLPMAEDEDPTTRGWVAEIIGLLAWRDQIPLLQSFATDPALDVRRSAMEALRTLGVPADDVELPDIEFPSVELAEILGEPLEAATPHLALAVGRCGDHEGVLELWDGHLALCDLQGNVLRTIPSDERMGHAVLSPSAAAGPLLVGLVVDPTTLASHGVALDASGQRVWMYAPGTTGSTPNGLLQDVVPLLGEAGLLGYVFAPGARLGVVAVDLQGRELWAERSVSNPHDLSTHPQVPGRIACAAGELRVFDASGKRLSEQRWTGSYYGRVVLFPGHEGRPSYLLGGEDAQDLGSILHLEADEKLRPGGEFLSPRWTATTGERLSSLVAIERPGASRLFAAGTNDGLLLLFDAQGVLRTRLQLPERQPQHLVSGIVGGAAVLVVTTPTLRRTYVLRG